MPQVLYKASSPTEPDFVSKISQCNVYGFTNANESVNQEIEEPLSLEDVIIREKGLHGEAYEEGLNHIARYVESFESRSNEIWLVFRHEGVSLSKLLYTAEEVVTDADKEKSEHGKRVQILRPSRWWHWLRTTEAGQEEFRNIIWQLLMALKSCHDRNITHRDIKPVYGIADPLNLEPCMLLFLHGFSSIAFTVLLRIIDFGSAVNDFTVKHLYGSVGPSSAEQTSEYAPPEAFLNVSWYCGPSSVTAKYDMWSVGVVILEFILGSPNVFQISSITQALLDQHLKGWNDSLKELAYNWFLRPIVTIIDMFLVARLRALMEMCILIPGISSKLHKSWGTNGEVVLFFSRVLCIISELIVGQFALKLHADFCFDCPQDSFQLRTDLVLMMHLNIPIFHQLLGSRPVEKSRNKPAAISIVPISCGKEQTCSHQHCTNFLWKRLLNTATQMTLLKAIAQNLEVKIAKAKPGMANKLGEATENRRGNNRGPPWIQVHPQ
ncbi:putative inactive protein kinase [Sesamum angolense]|uniref:Inactive protein kinase n=1 Tax=Sesamum angolense TaxID=2727404 RepID=A0AAE2C334_9LAMI|nr:putative inactive protein kinase [Sesamum angolense]